MSVSSVTGSLNSPVQTPQLSAIQSFRAGVQAFDQQRYSDAVDHLKLAESAFSLHGCKSVFEHFNCTIILSHCLYRLGETVEALDFYRKSLDFYKKSPSDFSTEPMDQRHTQLCKFLDKQKQFNELVIVLELFHQIHEGLGRDPHSSLFWLAYSQENLLDYQKAIEAYQKLKLAFPEEAYQIAYFLGGCYQKLQNYCQAINCYEEAINSTRNRYLLAHPNEPLNKQNFEPKIKNIRQAIQHCEQMQAQNSCIIV
ncbi:MAG: hypothetical protein K1000chlam2_01323 [Chlamydiae bacterium]|nr:hypothetical protein [Chlamydiota bacterium]